MRHRYIGWPHRGAQVLVRRLVMLNAGCGRIRTALASRLHDSHRSGFATLADRDVMTFFVPKYVALAACLLVIAPREAKAWSRDGHRIVCRIAWQLLDQTRRNEVDRLTSTYRNPDGQPVGPYWDACSYADDVRARARSEPAWRRFAVFETWHFANVPRTTTTLPSPPCPAPCVITAVHAHADSLRRGSDDAARAEALLFLSHWVGDLHQPLHLGYEDDRGGNNVRPIEGSYYAVSNLHALWDGGLLGKLLAGRSWQDFADQLTREITPAQQATWMKGTAADWSQESYNLVTSTKAQYCDWQTTGGAATCAPRPGSRTLDQQYQIEFADDVALRLQQAGVRLAETIRVNLTVP